jgi:hypothetical protein
MCMMRFAYKTQGNEAHVRLQAKEMRAALTRNVKGRSRPGLYLGQAEKAVSVINAVGQPRAKWGRAERKGEHAAAERATEEAVRQYLEGGGSNGETTINQKNQHQVKRGSQEGGDGEGTRKGSVKSKEDGGNAGYRPILGEQPTCTPIKHHLTLQQMLGPNCHTMEGKGNAGIHYGGGTQVPPRMQNGESQRPSPSQHQGNAYRS